MKRLSAILSNFAERFMPSPFIVTLFLTVIVFLFSIFSESKNPLEAMSYWHKGFWELLSFTMQMALILIFGYVLASTASAGKIIRKIIRPLKNTSQAAFVISLIAMLMSFLNWGLGLVFGAILARRFAEHAKAKGIAINYPIIGAAAYTGLIIWHGGLSGSAPLTVATENHFLANEIGLITVAQTIFSWQNILTTSLLMICVPLFLYALAKSLEPKDFDLKAKKAPLNEEIAINMNDKLDQSRWIGSGLGFIILAYLLFLAIEQASSLKFVSLNYVNFLLLALGLILHKSLLAYGKAFDEAVKSASRIILLFPFYAGIMGVMKYSGLTETLSLAIANFATAESFPLLTFLSSSLVNLFVPSGGGQWVVQGPILISAALENQLSISQTIMAFSYGDELSNMLQPFWALPLLGITGLKAKEILPFSILVMLISIPIFLIGIYLF